MQKKVSIMILDPNPGEAGRRGDALIGAAPDNIEIQAQGFATSDELTAALASSTTDCLLLHLGSAVDDGEQELLNRFARQSGGPATVVIADDVPLDRALEWIHRGIQDVLRSSLTPAELVRCIMMAMERKHLLNDANEALRLEQENVLKMQKFIDELVGFATRTATMGN